MPPIASITIVYDAGCGLCTRTKDWIGQQAPLVGIHFVASGSSDAQRRFPQLPAGELAVVANTGEVWLGNHAWIVCLWALRRVPRPRLQADQPVALPDGSGGVRGSFQEPFRALPYAKAAKRTGARATAQEGYCSEMPDRAEVRVRNKKRGDSRAYFQRRADTVSRARVRDGYHAGNSGGGRRCHRSRILLLRVQGRHHYGVLPALFRGDAAQESSSQ